MPPQSRKAPKPEQPPAKRQKESSSGFEIFIRGPEGPEDELSNGFVHAEQLRGLAVVDIACSENGCGLAYVLTANKEVKQWGGTGWTNDLHEDRGFQTAKSLIGEGIVQIAAGDAHFLAVGMSGAVYSWGKGQDGKLGHNDERDVESPKQIEALQGTHIVQVACGDYVSLFLTDRGEVYTCGSNTLTGHGILQGPQLVPLLVEGLKGKMVTQVSADYEHAAVVTDQCDLYTWGDGGDGRLGHSDKDDHHAPKLVEALRGKAKQVSCGAYHTAVVAEDGLYTFGGNHYGQLGDGDREERLEPTLVKSFGENVQVSCGEFLTACVAGGSLFTWGRHDRPAQLSPVKVDTLKDCRVSHVISLCDHIVAFVDPDSMQPGDRVPVTTALASMISDEGFSDVSFLVENQQVFALKGILVKRCPFFNAMFESGLSESTNHHNIPISDVRKETFVHMLEFLYTDTVNIEPEDVIELYGAADMYQLDRLKGVCLKSLENGLCVDNAAFLLEKASTSVHAELKGLCMKFLVMNLAEVRETTGFKQLECSTLLHEVIDAIPQSSEFLPQPRIRLRRLH